MHFFCFSAVCVVINHTVVLHATFASPAHQLLIFLCVQIYLRFLEYQMENSNECKRNFVAIYDGSSSIENLKAKFCSTVANDVMLDSGVGVVRMWADETSRLSRFRMLFTAFVDREFIFVYLWWMRIYKLDITDFITDYMHNG